MVWARREMARRILMAEVSGGRVRFRPRLAGVGCCELRWPWATEE